jgi:hypothetical protein
LSIETGLEGRGVGVRQGAAGGPEDLADAQVLERPGRDDQERVGVEVGDSSHRAPSALEMILDNFIVERVIGLVDGAEHNAAFLSVSVLTTAPFARQLDRAASVAGNIAHAVHAHQAVAQAGRVSRCANQSGCMMPGTGWW